MSTLGISIFFIITAAIGSRLFMYVKNEQRRPIALVAAHGILAVAGYGMLIYRVGFEARLEPKIPLEAYGFTFISFAAVAGFSMLIIDKILNKPLPKLLPYIHAILAATGLVILIISVIQEYTQH